MEHWADYVIFVGMLVASLGIGLYHAFTGGKQRTNEEFIMADRKLKLLPTSVSMMVSYMSALTIIGGPAEMYIYGFMLWPGLRLASLISAFMVINIIMPVIYPLKLTSVNTYFRMRYNDNTIQQYATVLGIITSLMYTSVAIYTPSMTLEVATGFPTYASIPILGAVCVVYTSLGGMRAVIWTDVFQSLIMFAGMLAIFIKATILVGGFTDIFTGAYDEGRLGVSFSLDPTVRHTVWTFVLGSAFGSNGLYGLSQPVVQRYSALPNLKQAQRSTFLWLLGTTITESTSYMTGLAMVAYYAKVGCDPLASKQISNVNMIVPHFLKVAFKGAHGFPGLFMATLYSATLSTASSTFSGASANAWTDLIKPRYPNLPEAKAALVSKCLVMVFGTISVGLAFIVGATDAPLIQIALSFAGAISGPVIGMFIVAGLRCLKWIPWKVTLSASVITSCYNFWLLLGSVFTKGKHQPLSPLSVEQCDVIVNATVKQFQPLTGVSKFYSVSYLWYSLSGQLMTIILSILIMVIIRCCFKKAAKAKIHEPSGNLFITWKCNKSDKKLLQTEQLDVLMQTSNGNANEDK